ncbi:SUKH-4 family immunity protein [Streptomyces sp. NPDC096152]|uniref:SUKH-4 family immunity protein n=1 Tax=Streptomyces sp. NPDC096152 TaxID=3366078 RepID=UPI003800C5D1
MTGTVAATVPTGADPDHRVACAPTRARPIGPGLMDTRPLAPCLETLVRFVAMTRELAGSHGGFALRPGRHGLTLDLPARLPAREFGPGRVARFEDVDFPAALTHEPTRRFLRETGLPDDGRLLWTDSDIPLPTLAEYCADEHPGPTLTAELAADADRLIHLGRLIDGTTVLLDGTTGAILNWPGPGHPGRNPRPLTTDVSTLTLTLCLLHRGM